MNYVKHPLAIVLLIVLVLPFLAASLGASYALATEMLVWAIVGLGFNLLLGYTGLLSFGHGAFFGIAAYAAAISQPHFARDMFTPMLTGVALGTLVGVAQGFLVLRRRGAFFSLLTLVFAQMFFYIAYRWTAAPGGGGPGSVARLPVLGFIDVTGELPFYYFVAVFALLLALAMWRLVRSPFGKVLRAIKQNEARARAIGYDTQRYLWLAFVISAFYTSVGGALIAYTLQSQYAQTQHLTQSGEIAAMTVVGGAFSFFGPLLGAAFYILLRAALSSYAENWPLIFVAVFILFVIISPAGIAGILRRLWLAARPGRPAPPPAPTPIRGGSDEAVAPPRLRSLLGEDVLVCTGVVKRFGASAAVDGVDLSVRRGELHALVGPNGAGKTTLCDCLSGALAPDGGQIALADAEIAGRPPHEIARRGVARSFQPVSIFKELTVFENARLGAQSRSERAFSLVTDAAGLADVNRQAREALALVGLAGREEDVAANLSPGDQRLLDLAIALASEPQLLLLDEPLAGLSPAERDHVLQLIRRLAGERAVLLVERDLDRVLEISDRITVLQQGKVIASGAPAVVQKDPAVRQAYLGHPRLEEVRQAAQAHSTAGQTILRVDRINTFRGQNRILRNVSLEVRESETVCLLGRNGAGKTTALESIVGTLPPRMGQVYFAGEQIAGQAPEAVSRLGLALVPRGGRVFPNLTVADNLGIARRQGEGGDWDLKTVYQQFPRLRQLRGRRGENLSGGEQQLLAIARALLTNPGLLLLDEPLEGLPPADAAEVTNVIQQLRGKVAMLLVEQNALLALALCDRAYVMSNGQITWGGAARALEEDAVLRTRLLGA